ncbi:MAG: aminotransferase class III-fold pyridoxal phosphate-dependent enzyme, partial [Cyanobacteriota bacterium]|nr:aminotransferase class III-fold pyridoxal phosphate-dependent enzyme [Cyanobacteriota bacterium]
GLTPDLMALSKGLTGGFLPMGVTMASERLHAGFIGTDPALTLYHGHSFTANPLGCAAALASLDLLLARPDRHEGFAARHQPLLADLARRPGVRRPRLQGTIAAFDLLPPQRAEPEGYLNPIGRQLQRRLLAEGVFLRPLGSAVYLLPPLCISDAELERCYSALAVALADL